MGECGQGVVHVFERFDSSGRRVVALAQDQARLLDHGYVGTEHLLLAVLALGGPMADALARRGAPFEAVQHEVEVIVGPVEERPRGPIPFTPRAKEVLELALREALRLGHRSIGTAHVVLGLLREGQGLACQALLVLGVDLRQLQREAEDIAGQPSDAPAPPPELSVDAARQVLRALEEAVGADVLLGALRSLRRGVVQAVVRRPHGSAVEIVTVVERGDHWELGDRP